MEKMKFLYQFWQNFAVPILVLTGMVFAGALFWAHFFSLASALLISSTAVGSYKLVKDTIASLLKRQFGLDYIALLAIVVSFITQEYFVAAIIALMIASGRTLEEYGSNQAKKSLTELVNRIPAHITLAANNAPGNKIAINSVQKGQEIFVRKGEVIGLDGILISGSALINEASLTGEPYPVEKIKGDKIVSGTINEGNPFVLQVAEEAGNSTYEKIIQMVKRAQKEKAPLVRLADRYSIVFTFITLLIAFGAFLYSHSILTVLAVLVLATPCPLILATPIALMGGMNAAAKKRIIAKKLSAIEVLSRATTLVFDKTGTLTLGRPIVSLFQNESSQADQKILSIAEALERNSLHPLASAIVQFAKNRGAQQIQADDIEEKIGIGIFGTVQGKRYSLAKLKERPGMAIGLLENGKRVATFVCEDKLKENAKSILKTLQNMGLTLSIFTGDKKSEAEKISKQIGENISIEAELSPEQKQQGIEKLKREGNITIMIGDGINDAPALALADVGIVFSNEERTASSDAADIVLLGGDFELVLSALKISKRAVSIALQSIAWGIGASIIGMILAALGYIPPVAGAIIQEAIDIAVIINALRASR